MPSNAEIVDQWLLEWGLDYDELANHRAADLRKLLDAKDREHGESKIMLSHLAKRASEYENDRDRNADLWEEQKQRADDAEAERDRLRAASVAAYDWLMANGTHAKSCSPLGDMDCTCGITKVSNDLATALQGEADHE